MQFQVETRGNELSGKMHNQKMAFYYIKPHFAKDCTIHEILGIPFMFTNFFAYIIENHPIFARDDTI